MSDAMIIKGSNNPIRVEFQDVLFDEFQDFNAVLSINGKITKEWILADIIRISENKINLPLLQSETMNFELGVHLLEIKFIKESNSTYYTRVKAIPVVNRTSKTILGENIVGTENFEALKIEVITNTVYETIGSGVSTVNNKNPDDKGNVDILADDINFKDGENFQEKYDKGELKGSKGDKGDKGEQGFVGDKGEKGDAGEQGQKGDKGDPFIYSDFTVEQLAELKGEKGDTGAQGEQGNKGDKGEQGDKGDPFVYSDFTPEQLASLKGDKGEKGDTGNTGEQGIQGDKGDAFAYEDFTPQQLADLKGDKGDKGDQGEQGVQGLKGDAGEQGVQGNKGDKGDTGETGKQGLQGEKGDAGEKGLDAVINGVNTLSLLAGTNITFDQSGDALTINASSEISGTVDYSNVTTETEPLINVDFVKLRYADASSSITVDGTSIDIIAPNGVVSGFSTSAFNVVPFTLYCLNAEKHTSVSQLNLIYVSTETGTSKQKTLLGNPLQYPNVYLTFNPESIDDIDLTKTIFLDYLIQDTSGGATYKITNFTLRDDSLKIYPNIKTNLLDSLKALDIASRGSAENLSMMLLGDSLTAAQGDSGWHYYTSQLLNIYDVTNVAMGGATLRDKEGTVYDGNPDINNPTNNTIGNQVQKIINNAYPEPDIIIMGIGLNDMSSFAEGIEDFTDAELTGTYYDSSFQKIPLENVDKKTTVGAFRYATETLHNLYPNAVIIINSESNTNQTERDPLLVMKYAERFEKLSLFASLPFINAKRCGINWANEFPWESPDQPGEYLYDGLHHTRKAAKLYGAYMASHIREFIDMVKYMKAL